MICDECNNEMVKSKRDISLKYSNKLLTVHDIDVWVCEHCGNEVIEDKEFEMIENLLK